MPHNDLLRSLRYTLNLNDDGVVAVFTLAGKRADREFVASILAREEEEGYIECGDIVASAFLDGLIIKKRGPRDGPPEPSPGRLTNNVILRKLKIAFTLHDDDLHAIFKLGEFPLSKPEISALFRREGHPNWRPLGDQAMRHFLRGLSLRERR